MSEAQAPASEPSALEVRLAPLTLDDLTQVIAVEQSVYGHPWTVGNFKDALASGYEAQRLLAGDTLIGYFVAMKVVDEVHLLNITVALPYRSQGWAKVMLDALALWSRGQGCAWLWLTGRTGRRADLAVKGNPRGDDGPSWGNAEGAVATFGDVFQLELDVLREFCESP